MLLVVPCPADRQCPDVATVNDQDTYGYSALHAAASYGHADVLAYLISKGGDVNIRDIDGDTPLHACDSAECAALLLAAGGDVNALNTESRSPLYLSLKDHREGMIEFLRANGAAPVEVPEGGFSDSDADSFGALGDGGSDVEGVLDDCDDGDGDGDDDDEDGDVEETKK